ncbi:hypothetical protein Tsubulata_039808 [Turnera subulata]|uniref:FAS1 domain-containing protein n=1 Tax=Turnera subulata TaxID=218843 RepID=A0A9Q0F3Q7_9ROSI|nr:hypothetical protein Tsubulata_039808 [Turnera subulata]
MASRSDWCQATMYITISVVLAFIAMSTALNSTPEDAQQTLATTRPINLQLLLNASRALRRSGFNVVALSLMISPESFFSSPNSTIFAIQDPALASTTSSPFRVLKHFLQYHTSPLKLSMDDLLKKPQGVCLPTLVQGKNVAVTKVDAKERLVEINHVEVSHPDLFLEEHIAIHGVLAPFSPLESEDFYHGMESIQAPVCDANSSLAAEGTDPKKMVEWPRIIRLLSSQGFVSFAIGLNSVLDGILEDHPHLDSVTVFTPPVFTSLASSPHPVLEKIVRLHLLPQKVTYAELASLPDKHAVKTLLPDHDLEVTGMVNATKRLTINGVEIVAPEIFSSQKFVVHGISQSFKMALFPDRTRQ